MFFKFNYGTTRTLSPEGISMLGPCLGKTGMRTSVATSEDRKRQLFLWSPYIVGSEVLMAVSKKMDVFMFLGPCCLQQIYQRFRVSYCVHQQDDDRGRHPDNGGSKEL